MITEQQRIARRQFLGSSDSASVFGLDPFRSAMDTYLDKTGADPGFAGNAATERGNYLEPAIVEWAREQIGEDLIRNVLKTRGDLCANLDAYNVSRQFIVEAKTTTNVDEWGDPGTDEIPDRVLIQTHHAMHVVGYALAYVPVLMPVFGRFEFRMYVVKRNDELAAEVARRGTEFMEHNVRLGIPPSDSKPSLEVLKRIRRTPNKVVPVDSCLVDRWIVAKDAAMQAKDDADEAQAAILAALQDADGGTCQQGALTYFTTKRAGYAVEPTEFRQLRLKKRKD